MCGQILVGFTSQTAAVAFRAEDVLLPPLLLRAVRQAQRELKHLGRDPILAVSEPLVQARLLRGPRPALRAVHPATSPSNDSRLTDH